MNARAIEAPTAHIEWGAFGAVVALAGCNPVAFGKWCDSTVPHERKKRRQ